MDFVIQPSQLKGEITIPASKSHTMRAILFATLAHGHSIIHDYLHSPDTDAMIAACRAMGASIQQFDRKLHIQGTAGAPQTPSQVLDAGNSGQVLRFVGAISALLAGPTTLTGDHSLCHHRFVQPFLDGIAQWGGQAMALENEGRAPIRISGPLTGGYARVAGQDSQNITALLIASVLTPHAFELEVADPGETPWIDLTLAWFERLNIPIEQDNYRYYRIPGPVPALKSFEYRVPGDFSSAAFPIVAALITQSEIQVHNIDMQDVQGDKAIISCLLACGAQLEIIPKLNSIIVKKSPALTGMVLDVNPLIDALPILAVTGCFTTGTMSLVNAAIARQKESDRLHTMHKELSKMGAQIIEQNDKLLIQTSQLIGNTVHSHQDHRIAMALTVAALAAKSKTRVCDVACIAKSYPHFAESLQHLGAKIEVIE